MSIHIPIKLGKKQYYITSDSRNFMLAQKVTVTRKNKKTGVSEECEDYKAEWFYGTLKGLFDGIFELKLKACNAKEIQDLYDEMLKIKKELTGFAEDHQKDLAIELTGIGS